MSSCMRVYLDGGGDGGGECLIVLVCTLLQLGLVMPSSILNFTCTLRVALSISDGSLCITS